MEDEHTLKGLLGKRAEVAVQIEQAQTELRKLVTTADHLDAAIRLFDPEAVSGPVKRLPPRAKSSRGEIVPLVLGALRTAESPLATRQVTIAVLKGRGLPPDDLPLVHTMTNSVSITLRRMRQKGAVIGDHDGGQIWWRLA